MLEPRHLLWKLECHLNRSLAGHVDTSSEFVLRAGSADIEARPVPSNKKLCIVVTTHRRPNACAKMLEALADSLDRARITDVFVLVLNDPADADYSPVKDVLHRRFPKRFAFYEARRWLGKQLFWVTYQQAFDVIRRVDPDRTLFIQDDLVFRPDFVGTVLETWASITDPQKLVLCLLAMEDDETHGRWIRYPRTSVHEGRLWRTQWFDLAAFIVGRRFFDVLRFRVFPVPRARWRADPRRGSGVNEQFTRRLFGRGNIYQEKTSAVFHGSEASVMNADARRARPLDNLSELNGGALKPPRSTR